MGAEGWKYQVVVMLINTLQQEEVSYCCILRVKDVSYNQWCLKTEEIQYHK
jgi:hypothetical protein